MSHDQVAQSLAAYSSGAAYALPTIDGTSSPLRPLPRTWKAYISCSRYDRQDGHSDAEWENFFPLFSLLFLYLRLEQSLLIFCHWSLLITHKFPQMLALKDSFIRRQEIPARCREAMFPIIVRRPAWDARNVHEDWAMCMNTAQFAWGRRNVQ